MTEERHENTVVISTRVPKDIVEDLERARKIIGALNISEIIRRAIEHYLNDLTVLSERKKRILRGREHEV